MNRFYNECSVEVGLIQSHYVSFCHPPLQGMFLCHPPLGRNHGVDDHQCVHFGRAFLGGQEQMKLADAEEAKDVETVR